jgi:hypothetical protein
MTAELDGFGWMRVLRNSTPYPSLEKPLADIDDTVLAQGFEEEIIGMARKNIEHMLGYRPSPQAGVSQPAERVHHPHGG